MSVFNIKDYGAVDGGTILCTDAISKAVEECEKNGGGKIYIPAGKYLTGPIFLKSNMNLYLESGAVLVFSDNPEDYPVVVSRWEGVKRDCYASCINAYNAENISITGRGVIDGNGANWWKIFRAKENKYPRPKLIAPYECNNVLIEGVKLQNSPSWTINTILCENVTVDKITINNPSDSPNTDGIDPESCNNVHISNCHIDVGDDCIAVKAGTEDTEIKVPCTNITITNCTMVHGHGGVVLGSEMSGGIVNVTISNCVFEGTDRGIRLKSRRGRGGCVEDVRVSNIVMNKVLCPFIANLYYFCGPKGDDKYVWDKNPYPITEETPAFRRLHFSNITAKNVSASAGYFYGLAEMYVEDIAMDNVYISMDDDAVPAKPAMLAGIEDMKQKGFFIANSKNFVFSNVTVSGADGPAFEIESSDNMIFNNCKGINSRSNSETFKTTNVSKFVQN